MADTVPLPEPAYPAGTTGMLGESAWDRHQMRTHAAAQSAADNAALRERVKVLEDALGEISWSNNSKWQSDRADAALNARAALEAK